MKKVRVGVHGYGVIGKRIADAVILQDDMELVGVTARTPDFRLLPAVKKNITIYGSDEEHRQQIEQAGIKTAGSLPDLVKVIDVIIDATPKGVEGTPFLNA